MRVVAVVGVVAALAGCVVQAGGMALQGRARPRAPLRRNRLWWQGVALAVAGGALAFAAALAALPLAVAALLPSAALACQVLARDSRRGRHLAASAAVAGGCVLVCLGGWDWTPAASLDTLQQRFSPFGWWLGVSVIGAAGAACRGRLACALSAGTLGAHALALAKGCVLVVADAVVSRRRTELARPEFAALALGAAVLTAAQVCALNRALRCVGARDACAPVVCAYTAVGTANGALLAAPGSLRWGPLAAGTACVVLGVVYGLRGEPPCAEPPEPNRTTMLSYASLRPLSMDSAGSAAHEPLQPRSAVIADEPAGDTGYVSFHQRAGSELGGSRRGPLLSFEQEELLAQLV